MPSHGLWNTWASGHPKISVFIGGGGGGGSGMGVGVWGGVGSIGLQAMYIRHHDVSVWEFINILITCHNHVYWIYIYIYPPPPPPPPPHTHTHTRTFINQSTVVRLIFVLYSSPYKQPPTAPSCSPFHLTPHSHSILTHQQKMSWR